MMVLTGVAQENDWMEGVAKFFLVFNQGEFRLPVPEEAMHAAVQQLSASMAQPQHESAQTSPDEGADVFGNHEHPVAPFRAPEAPDDVSDYAHPPDHDVTETEEDVDDGVAQI